MFEHVLVGGDRYLYTCGNSRHLDHHNSSSSNKNRAANFDTNFRQGIGYKNMTFDVMQSEIIISHLKIFKRKKIMFKDDL